VWNYTHNTWTTRDLPDAPHISSGVVDTSVSDDAWTVADGNWDDWTIAWGQIGYNPMASSPLLCSTKLLKGDSTDQFDGVNMTSRIERLYIPIGTPDDIVRIKRIYPHMIGSGTVNFYVGTHMRASDPVTYKSPVFFTPGTDRKVDVNTTGAYLAIKIESNSNIAWSISGFDVEYELTAKR